jgi:hypothetical protein
VVAINETARQDDGVVEVGRSAQTINVMFAAPRRTARGGAF